MPDGALCAASLVAGLAREERDRLDAARLRYDVYIREQGKAYDGADHAAGHFTDSLDANGEIVIVRRNDRAVGTVRVNHFDNLDVREAYGADFAINEFIARWPPAFLVTCTRLAVAREERGSEVSASVFTEVYRYGVRLGVRFCLVACASRLQPLFCRYGFRAFLPPVTHPIVGIAHRLVLVIDDQEHFARVRSPFERMVVAPERGREAAAWFGERFAVASCVKKREDGRV